MKNVEKLINEWVQMWNSYDCKEVDRLFITDSSLTYFSSEKPGIICGIDSLREHHRGFGFVDGGKTTDKRLWLENINIKEYGLVSIATATWLFQRATGPVQRGPVTFVIVASGNECRFSHVHFANDPIVR